MCFYCCRRRKNKDFQRKIDILNEEPIETKLRVYERGKELLSKNMDISKVITSFILVDKIMHTLFSRRQRLLTLMQRNRVIDEEGTEDESEQDFERKNSSLLNQVYSKNFDEKLRGRAALTRILMEYKDRKLTAADMRLLKGFYEHYPQAKTGEDIYKNGNLLEDDKIALERAVRRGTLRGSRKSVLSAFTDRSN